jgi:hypothetical protein
LEELPEKTGKRKAVIKQLGTKAEPHIKEMARRHTPLSHSIYRNTRQLLREYEKRGILKAQVPRRKPHIKRVTMRSDEQVMYNRLDEYITSFYHKYEKERRGLGFIMTVYRRRLTSSFYAVRTSLERRLAYLKGQLESEKQFGDDDIEQDELDFDIGEEILDPVQYEFFQAELEYVQNFIQQLKLLSANDSKMEVLKEELHEVFRKRSKVLIFTQYTDTMDYLREQLREVYGSQVACYSGHGGEIWNGIVWVPTTKEEVKNRFRDGKISILLGTESASEGLNLQTCGVLINYDMPWNPMRVEQRIGRIDRIGQEYKEVWVSNYFYKDTIEDQIYQRLADRIDWFEVVVGDLQPILAEVGEVTRRLAMLPLTEREASLELEITALKKRLDHRAVESLNLDDFIERDSFQGGIASPITLEQIRYLLTQSQMTSHLFRPHPEIRDAYMFCWKGESLPVTFSPKVFDDHPDTVRFLSYGSPLLVDTLESIQGPEEVEQGTLVRCRADKEVDLRGWYIPDRNNQTIKRIDHFVDLKEWLEKSDDSPIMTISELDQTIANLRAEYCNLIKRQAAVIQLRHKAEYLTLRVRAQNVLLQATIVEIALGRSPEMFETEIYPSHFTEEAVVGLQRHGFPWKPLLTLAWVPGLKPEESDPYYQKIASDKRESLKGRFHQLVQEARGLVQLLSDAQNTIKEEKIKEPGEISFKYYA